MVSLILLAAFLSASAFFTDNVSANVQSFANEQIDINEESYNVLLLGEDESGKLDDVIMIVSCDTKSKKINVLQIPRDTYAEYTLSSYRKINAASDVLDGSENLSVFLTETLGIPIDGCISIDIDIIAETVDVLGGVEIDVPMDMMYKDPYQDLTIEIKKGKQILSGDKAEQFVRYREGYIRGDLGRLDAQKLFMTAFLKKIAEKNDIVTLVQIASTIMPKTESNISLKESIDLIGKMGIPDISNINFMTLPGGDIRGGSGAWYYIMNRKSAYKIIKEHFNNDLSEADFDKNRKFTSTVREGFNDIYDAQNGFEPQIFSADEISGELEIESKYD